MPPDIYEQLLQAPRAQLVELALVGLGRQGEMLASVIDSVWGQVDDVIGATRAKRIYLTGCGDSYFAALSARYAFEQLTGVPTIALESMEFAYALLPRGSLVIAISSGGEVSTTLRAGEYARQSGVDVIGVTAQAGSQMTQELPCLITGPDLSKGDPVDQVALMLGNFSFSLAALYIAAIHIGQSRGHLNDQTARKAKAEIRVAPPAIKQAMDRSVDVQEYLEKVSDEADFYFLGAGPSYGVALFYQAKFFEQAQRPVYGVELEEFAHEQFFLLQPNGNAQLWFIAPAGRSREQVQKIMGGCREMGAHLIAVTTLDSEQVQEKANLTFALETTSEMFSPLISVVPGELLGIHAFARWGGGALSAAERRDQMAISRRLTRKENIEHP